MNSDVLSDLPLNFEFCDVAVCVSLSGHSWFDVTFAHIAYR